MQPHFATVTATGIVITGPDFDEYPLHEIALPGAAFELHELHDTLSRHGWGVASRWEATIAADKLSLRAAVLWRRAGHPRPAVTAWPTLGA